MNKFWKALIATAIPIVALSIISTAGMWTGINDNNSLFGIAWFVALVLLFAAFVTAIVFAATGRRQLMAGIFAGAGIGILAMGTTCFASLTNLAI